MKRVPTRTPAAPAASAAATPARRGDPAAGDHGHGDRVEHRVQQRQQRRSLDPLAPAGLPALDDDDVGPGLLRRDSVPRRLDLPATDRTASVHEIDERAVRLGEEEVDVGRAAGDERQRVAVHERDDEVHPEGPRRGRELVEHGSSAAGGRKSAGYTACPPARATASGSAAPTETQPIGASWIGRSQRSSSVRRRAMRRHYAPVACRARMRCAGLSRRGLGRDVVAAAAGGRRRPQRRLRRDAGRRLRGVREDPRGAAPGEFAGEAEGLRWLASAGALRVAEPLAVGDDWLALRWIERGRLDAAGEEELGRGLAALHRAGAPSFGGPRPLRLGPLELPNDPSGGVAVVLRDAAPGAARRPGRAGRRRRAGVRADRRAHRPAGASVATARRSLERQRARRRGRPAVAHRSGGLRRAPRGRSCDARAVRDAVSADAGRLRRGVAPSGRTRGAGRRSTSCSRCSCTRCCSGVATRPRPRPRRVATRERAVPP